MKKWTGTSLALTLALSCGATSVMASAFEDKDMAFAFEQEGSMEVATLSEQEMSETEGEYWQVPYYIYVYSPQITAASMWAYNMAPRIGTTINSIQNNYIPKIQNWWNGW